MLLFKNTADIEKYISIQRNNKQTIGFVPTMGALHHGHLSLIRASNAENDLTVCSIFVNPTQFDNSKDLEKYPRTLSNDILLLTEAGCDMIFAPTVTEVYPKGLKTAVKIDLGHIGSTMEGAFRQGHFEGMMEVVHRLLNIVNPHNLYMGQKDFQQQAIVGHMIKTLGLETNLVTCPIIREEDGLAMSSRNVRLTPSIRENATILHKSLCFVKDKLEQLEVDVLKETALEMLTIDNFKPEYFEIVDGYTLKKVDQIKDHHYIVACTAVWAGEVRLIDNMILKKELRD